MRSKLSAVILAVALAGVGACTGDQPAVAPTSSTTPTVTGTATGVPSVASTTRSGPWQVGEPIQLEAEPYNEATLTEVTAETRLPDRDTLDRDGGAFAWERASGRLLFIEGLRKLYLAPGSADGRPIGIALTPRYDVDELRSLIVRLEPFEVFALPTFFNVSGQWLGPTTARVSVSEAGRVEGRTLPEGEYTLELETAVLELVRPLRRGTSSAIDVEATWRQGPNGAVSMLVQNGRRALRRGDGGLREELAGNVGHWEVRPGGEQLLMVANQSQLVVYDFALDRLWVLGRPAEYGAVEWSVDGRYLAATVFDSFEDTTRVLVFDPMDLDAVASPDFGQSPADGLALPPIEDSWLWRWRSATELFVGGEMSLSLLNVETGDVRTILDDRQPYDTLAWDEPTSTLARSRLRGVPVSILELGEGGEWFDIPVLAASSHVGLFDMNWGAGGKWLALNTAPGRS